MDQKVEGILKELLEWAPELKGREDDMRKTIKNLLSSRPDTGFDPNFKKELLEKILDTYVRRRAPKKKKTFFMKPMFVLSTAAALVILGIGLVLLLPHRKSSIPENNVVAQKVEKSPQGEPNKDRIQIKEKAPETIQKPAQKKDVAENAAKTTAVPAQKDKEIPVVGEKGSIPSAGGILEVKITDHDGFPLPGVEVIVADKSGKTYKEISGENGVVAFKNLPAGQYQVRSQLQGFKSYVLDGLEMAGNQKIDRAITMVAAPLEEVVTVIATSPIVDAKKSVPARPGVYAKTIVSKRSGVDNRHDFRAKNNIRIQKDEFNTENYEKIEENEFLDSMNNPLSTFSIDVDTASYSNVRRFINQGAIPPADSARIEEMINYFPYQYPLPKSHEAFSINTESSVCPWNKEHKLVLIGLKGQDLEEDNIPPSNLVFLIDVSGSMNDPMKLPLLQDSFSLLVNELGDEDRVAIVVYASSSGLVLPSTSGRYKERILDSINRLRAGGTTAGGEGLKLAYDVAVRNFIKGGNNRVILATDGDFNVGPSSDAEMERLIEEKRKSGVFLTILGYGMGNYKDSKMEKISSKGNGNYFYIDSLLEARKVLVNDLRKTLFTIAKDVKIQVEFNPAKVKSYRLIGYEHRMLNKEDFEDDAKDAGEIGAGHTVTAFYEIVPMGRFEKPSGTNLRYQKSEIDASAFDSDEIMTVKIRYKKPDEDTSKLIEKTVKDKIRPFEKTSETFRFASSVAEFGMILRDSKFKGTSFLGSVIDRAEKSLGADKEGYRHEFIDLVRKTERLINTKIDR